MNVELSTTGTSDEIRVNEHQQNFKLGIFVIPGAGVTFSGAVEYTPDGENWMDVDDLADVSEKMAGNVFFPVCGVRLRLDSVSGGKVILSVTQGA